MTGKQDATPEEDGRSSFDVAKISPEPPASVQHNTEEKRLFLEGRRLEGDLQASRQSQAQGILGKVLGDKDHAPTNAVGFSLLFLVAVSASLALMRYEDTIGFVDLAKSVIIGAFGYFAGARTVRGRQSRT